MIVGKGKRFCGEHATMVGSRTRAQNHGDPGPAGSGSSPQNRDKGSVQLLLGPKLFIFCSRLTLYLTGYRLYELNTV